MKLYSYWRSSAAFRVRIVLNLKGLEADYVPIHLLKDGGENYKPDYVAINPAAKLPSLILDDGTVLTQSLAILEYLDETHPEPALLPADPAMKAQVRAFAQTIACDIHPLQNSAVLKYLKDEGGFSSDEVYAWSQHWIAKSFTALEEGLKRRNWQGPHAFGEQLTLADVCLVPQFFNARRFAVDLEPFPMLRAVEEAARAVPAFFKAAPGNQPDAE